MKLKDDQVNHWNEMCIAPGDKEIILGGQKSGKTKRAELHALAWLQANKQHKAIYLATGQAWDGEMRARIARHQVDRNIRVSGMQTYEVPLLLAQRVEELNDPHTLLVVDCLTMWLTNWTMPMSDSPRLQPNWPPELDWEAQRAHFLESLERCDSPVVLVGNEIGLGVIPMGCEVRSFVDNLGVLNQDVANVCNRVTLMVAGIPLRLK